MIIITAASDWRVFFKDPAKVSPLSRAMAENLLGNILVPLLPVAGGSFELYDGARELADIARLEALGYHPSKTTDHFFGIMEPTAGAGDVVPKCGAERFFEYVKKNTNRAAGTIVAPSGAVLKVGQIILEKNRTAWIHISNPRRLFWPKAAGKTTLLISTDNGKTYRAV